MKKQIITEEMNIQSEWFEQAKNMKLDDLQGFINHLLNDYKHDYGTIVHALSAGAIATVWAMNSHEQGGITGFQASLVMWDFIRQWIYSHNKTGLRIIDFDSMLYPQYEDKFDKVISIETWKALQQEAKERLQKDKNIAHPDVIKHWESIINGIVPFGYKVKEV